MAGDYLYNAFNPQWSSNATTANIVYTGNSTIGITGTAAALGVPIAGWSDVSMQGAARKVDPLDWLKGRVGEYVEMGTLRD
jgi:hypothetical protein